MAYDKNFFAGHKEGSLSSAREIVPIIMELVEPKKVVDVGCGLGEWLSVFRERGASEVLGIDGKWVDKNRLLIPREDLQFANLEKPLEPKEKFDLAVCLEVAEHLPENCAATLVDSLTKFGPVILFSAAIPHQGGNGHKNEQWPEYWQKLFEGRNYLLIDCIRRRIWDNDKVAWWYAQNIFLAVEKEFLDSHEILRKQFSENEENTLSLVHPRNYLSRFGVRSVLIGITPAIVIRTVKKFFIWLRR